MTDIIIELIQVIGELLESIREFVITLSGATNVLIYALSFVMLIIIIFWVVKRSIEVIPST